MKDWIEKSCHDTVAALQEVGLMGLADDMSRILQAGAVKYLSVFRSPQLESIVEALRSAEDPLDIGDCLIGLCVTLDVTHATVHVLEQQGEITFDPMVVTTYPDSWVEEYVAENYAASDPVIALARVSGRAFYWDEIELDAEVSEAFYRDAQEQGMGGAGYTIPVNLWSETRVALTLSSMSGRSALREKLEPLEGDLALLAQEFIEAFVEISSHEFSQNETPPAKMLTAIRAMAHGATLEEAVREVGLDDAKSVAEEICDFYDSRTVMQAVMRCVQLDHLRGVPLMRKDIISAARNSTSEEPAPLSAGSSSSE